MDFGARHICFGSLYHTIEILGCHTIVKWSQHMLHVYKSVVTVCQRSIDPIYIVIYYKKWAKTFWTYSTNIKNVRGVLTL